jgi:60 kDa SS-A/Ro ribonucleoprotein
MLSLSFLLPVEVGPIMSVYDQFARGSNPKTPQPVSVPTKHATAVNNDGGGYSIVISDEKRFLRFLIMGSASNFYKPAQEFTKENAETAIRLIKRLGARAVDMIVEVSTAGRALKQDPAIFALALAKVHGDLATKRAVVAAVPKVCRIGTDILMFTKFLNELGGMGRASKAAVNAWYLGMPEQKLAYQVTKYASRNGMSHKDAIRLSHPTPDTADRNAIFHYLQRGWESVGSIPHGNPNLLPIWAAERAKETTKASEIVTLITDYKLPWEVLPTQFLRERTVWEALLPHMGMTALLRNLGRISNLGMTETLQKGNVADFIIDQFNEENVRRSRLHPFRILTGLVQYQQGKGDKGSLEWKVNSNIAAALDSAFYMAFQNVVPTGKRILLGVDVSGSMAGAAIGIGNITACMAAAAMAMVFKRVERNAEVFGFSHVLTDLKITAKDTLREAMRKAQDSNWGSTNPGLLIEHAQRNRLDVDAVMAITDNDVNTGYHTHQLLDQYRAQGHPDTKMIVVATNASQFSIARQDDLNALDVAGFDSAAPELIQRFIAGDL